MSMTETVPAAIEGVTTVTAKVPAQTVEVLPEKKSPPLPPNTTAQQDLTTAGQRRVNLVWEFTQAFIAVATVITCMTIFVVQAVTHSTDDFPDTLSNMTFSILAFYLARTNHQAIGGVGAKPVQPYEGR